MPVPIAQTGSVGDDAEAGLLRELVEDGAACRSTTASVSPASRCSSVSPTQTMGAQLGGHRRGDLPGDRLVGLGEQLPLLAVPEDHPGRARP